MTTAEIKRTALELPADERQELAAALWQSLENDPNWLPEWQRQLIDERLEASQDDPGQTWSEVKAELWPQSA